jgi:hypothetical protein
MKDDEFREEVAKFWTSTIASIFGRTIPQSATWRGVDDIREIYVPFMARDRNHAHLPTGGGLDLRRVADSCEDGCIEFSVGDRAALVLKPRALTFEYIPESPIDSFLLLDLAELQPVVAERSDDRYPLEEVAELTPCNYVERGVLDQGFLGYDENGREIPIPEGRRVVMRWLNGKILLVAKRSLWNGTKETYDGRHNKMSAEQIRKLIENGLSRR